MSFKNLKVIDERMVSKLSFNTSYFTIQFMTILILKSIMMKIFDNFFLEKILFSFLNFAFKHLWTRLEIP